MTICKGKRYIKPTCDKCVELPYCKPTEKTKFKKAQQVYNTFLFDSHIKTLREVELQEKRIAKLETDIKTRGEDFRRLAERVLLLESNALIGMKAYRDLETAIHRLETHIGTLQRHGEEIDRLESQVVVLEGTIKEHNVKIHRLETHIDVMESNARVATECSNKQAYAIEALQTEIHFIKERLAQCQDSVAELDPLGCVIVRKRGRPRKSS